MNISFPLSNILTLDVTIIFFSIEKARKAGPYRASIHTQQYTRKKQYRSN